MNHYKIQQMNLSDYGVNKRLAKQSKRNFFLSIDQLIDWAPIEKELNKISKRGQNARGQKAYPPLVLFKMQLVSLWYQLSDEATEDTVSDSASASRFCGLSLEDDVPDSTTLSRFRTELTEKKAYDRLLRKINNQLQQKGMKVDGCVKVDATITQSPFIPKAPKTFEVVEDRQEDQRSEDQEQKETQYHQALEVQQPGADHQARWTKKSGQYHYGYKAQIATNSQGLVLAVHSTPANQHDSKGLKPLLEKLPKHHRKKIYADKGYRSQENEDTIKNLGSRSRVMYKAYKNKPLTPRQTLVNKLISKTRWVVERTFGSIKRWFGAASTRLKGLDKVHGFHVLGAMAYNLKRAVKFPVAGSSVS